MHFSQLQLFSTRNLRYTNVDHLLRNSEECPIFKGRSTTGIDITKIFWKQSCLMRKRKTCILVITIFSCLYLLYRSFSQGIILTYPFLTVPQIICNTNYFQSSFNETLKAKPPTVQCRQGNLMYGNFCVISPYSLYSYSKDEPSVTLTTQGTVEFLHHIVVLCRRWSGPISVAVFSPPEDYLDARRVVDALRDCDFCIRHWVSWHFFYFNIPMPDYTSTDIPRDCKFLKQKRPKRRRSKGIYPINAGRNIARSRTATPYVFAIDIELYPSVGILPKFERMLRTNNISDGLHVWAFPVFEVYSKYRAPVTKSDLRAMFIKKQAISFHQYRCDICHKIPNLTQWLNSDASLMSEGKESLDTLKVWSTVKRNKKYHLHAWEPFFIGTRDDPEFDVRLSWEGRQNKMQVAFEMCLMDYNFHIVENGFLVHSPGINVYNASEERFRNKHSKQNNKLILAIRKDLIKVYGSNNDC